MSTDIYCGSNGSWRRKFCRCSVTNETVVFDHFTNMLWTLQGTHQVRLTSIDSSCLCSSPHVRHGEHMKVRALMRCCIGLGPTEGVAKSFGCFDLGRQRRRESASSSHLDFCMQYVTHDPAVSVFNAVLLRILHAMRGGITDSVFL